MTPERRSAFLRPEFPASHGNDGIENGELPGLVDDDTSSGEEEGSTLVRHEADSLF